MGPNHVSCKWHMTGDNVNDSINVMRAHGPHDIWHNKLQLFFLAFFFSFLAPRCNYDSELAQPQNWENFGVAIRCCFSWWVHSTTLWIRLLGGCHLNFQLLSSFLEVIREIFLVADTRLNKCTLKSDSLLRSHNVHMMTLCCLLLFPSWTKQVKDGKKINWKKMKPHAFHINVPTALVALLTEPICIYNC